MASWPAPKEGDILWCLFPYPDRKTQRHPVLVLLVDSSTNPTEVIVAGGSSFQKGSTQRLQRAHDLLISASDPWFNQTGLENPTCFHFDEPNVLRLPYDESMFVGFASGGPRVGRLPLFSPEVSARLQRAGQAGNLSATFKNLRLRK